MIRIMIVDDHDALRSQLRTVLESEPDFDVCGLAGSGEAGVALARSIDPDVVVMDLAMPGMGGVAATRALTECPGRCRVVALSWSNSHQQVESALRAGAARFVAKSDPPGQLVAAVRLVAGEVAAVP